MTVGILGLGLIGGSLARAYAVAGHTVYAAEKDESILAFAQLAGAVDAPLTDDNIGSCELILLAIYPEGCVRWLSENARHISKNALVIDCCGVKERVCESCFPLAEEFDFTFIGGHPMAGRHYSGLSYSTKTMYNGASMVLVPQDLNNTAVIERAKKLLSPIKFGKFTICDADRHDAMIAFTSQMAHVVSNAYVKSPTAKSHDGFSAGSYKDLTRVAWLNENMWTELFLENKTHLLNELDYFINSLIKYRDSIAREDADTLKALLAEGKHCKEEIDGISE